MKVTPISIVSILTQLYHDQITKTDYIKDGNKIKQETQSFPLYDSAGSVYKVKFSQLHGEA